MVNAAIFLLAGQSSRMKGQVVDKNLLEVHGKPLFCYSLETFLETDIFNFFVFVSRNESQKVAISHALSHYNLPESSVIFTPGGPKRQDSVFNGLNALPESVSHVFVHDCARPLIQKDSILELKKQVEQDHAAVLAYRVTDTIKYIDSGDDLSQCTLNPLDRSKLWAMETPQAAEKSLLHKAYQFTIDKNLVASDETSALSYLGHSVSIVENHSSNTKVTFPQDLEYIKFLLNQKYAKRS